MTAAPDLLLAIVAATRRITDVRRAAQPAVTLERVAAQQSPRGAAFAAALGMRGRVNVIAECKRRSPSRGVLAAEYDPVAIAKQYEAGGAVAISVLTEPTFFDGALAHLTAVRQHVGLPVLRKDFIVDEYQLLEARAAGADAVLLIVAALDQRELTRLREHADAMGLAALVEVHDEEELSRAVDCGARLVGVNNRNLRTLAVDVNASDRLAARMPLNVVGVSESGLQTRADLERLAAAGYNAFLIGERFMTAADPAKAIQELKWGRESFYETRKMTPDPIFKICGITRLEDALHAVGQGATAIGFVFWSTSPRQVSREIAAAIVRELPRHVMTVGVFVNATLDEIRATVRETGIATVQLHGDEPPSYADAIDRPIIRSVTLDKVVDVASEWPAKTMLLLDTADPIRRGGTGHVVDWSRAAAIARGRQIILAGGLTPANVEEAIMTVRPFGVDVSSGVEASPGVKDLAKVSRFLENARAAYAQFRGPQRAPRAGVER